MKEKSDKPSEAKEKLNLLVKAIKQIRISLKLSRVEMARGMDISHQTLYRLETGKIKFSDLYLIKMISFLERS